MVTVRQAIALMMVASLILAAVIAVVFQDNIVRFNLNPRTPYQIYTPPPPPAYGARGAWIVWPDDRTRGDADVFYVHSTTYASRRQWNAPITAAAADRDLRLIAAPNEAGPFMAVGAVYGPRYRQATLFANFTHKYDGLAAHGLAYRDVEKAFDAFLSERPADRPLILAGYGQGGLHVLGLLQSRFAENAELRAQLAVAYIIREPAPLPLFDDVLKDIPPCNSAEDIRCVISYIDLEAGFEEERRRYRSRSLMWNDDKNLVSLSTTPLLCVNPLSWSIDDTPISAEHHIGAASATGVRLGETPPAITNVVSARCDNGILTVDSPQQAFLRRKHWFGAQWKPQNFNLFYHDLTVDAQRRVQNLVPVLEAEARVLKPIEEAVDLEVSPINKAPE